jgi:RNA polymerase sigma factor (sigma-70 family)
LKGNELAWRILVDRYKSLVYAILKKYNLSKPQADDLFQITFLKVLEHLPRLRKTDKFRAWLITIVVRLCWEEKHQQHSRMHNELSISANAAEGQESHFDIIEKSLLSDEWLIKLEQQHQIETAFRRLPEQCQKLLGYLYYCDPPASYKEIAAETGICFNSIAPVRSRCLEKLKLFIEEETGSSNS